MLVLDSFATHRSVFVLGISEVVLETPRVRGASLVFFRARKNRQTRRSRKFEKAFPRNEQVRSASVRRAAASNVGAATFAASGTMDFGGPVVQNDNVSFTMSDKSAIPFGKLVRPSCWLILLLINHP